MDIQNINQSMPHNLSYLILQLGFSLKLFPDELNVLKHKHLALKLSVTHYNVTNKNNQYSITRFAEDEHIIEELSKNLIAQVNNLYFLLPVL